MTGHKIKPEAANCYTLSYFTMIFLKGRKKYNNCLKGATPLIVFQWKRFTCARKSKIKFDPFAKKHYVISCTVLSRSPKMHLNLSPNSSITISMPCKSISAKPWTQQKAPQTLYMYVLSC